MNTFGKRLKEARLAHQPKRLTQKEVADRAGISQTTVADIERGRNDGSKYLAELAGAVNCSLTWLATNKGGMHGGDVLNQIDTRNDQPRTHLTPDQQKILSIMEGLAPEARDALLKAISLLSKRQPERRRKEMGDIVHGDTLLRSEFEDLDESKEDLKKRGNK